MPYETDFDTAFTILLGKARNGLSAGTTTGTSGGTTTGGGSTTTSTPRLAGIDFFWSGGGLPLDVTTLDPLLAEVPFPSTLVYVHMYAGNQSGVATSCTASVEIVRTSAQMWGGSVGFTTVTMSGATSALLNPGGTFDTGDGLLAVPTSISGTATWLAVILQIRSTEAALGVATVVDTSGTTITTSDGTPIVQRSGPQ